MSLHHYIRKHLHALHRYAGSERTLRRRRLGLICNTSGEGLDLHGRYGIGLRKIREFRFSQKYNLINDLY